MASFYWAFSQQLGFGRQYSILILNEKEIIPRYDAIYGEPFSFTFPCKNDSCLQDFHMSQMRKGVITGRAIANFRV